MPAAPLPQRVSEAGQETDRPGTQSIRFLVLPGWRGSGPEHWQSRWVDLHACELVEQSDWEWPRRGDWMARLDDAVQASPEAQVVLIAHSLGCHLVAAWSAYSQHTARIRAALLVAPPDLESDDLPPQVASWRPVGVHTGSGVGSSARSSAGSSAYLPFPSRVVISTDDPYCSVARAEGMAAQWGSETLILGAHGHINSDSGLGAWQQGWALVQGLLGASNDGRQSPAW